MSMKNMTIAILFKIALFSSVSSAAPPGKPTIDWGEFVFSFIKISPGAEAYKELVSKVVEQVDIEVKWTTWEGDPATSVRILMNGNEVWQGPASGNNVTFQMYKGGIYEMVVELSNADGSATSDPQEVVIFDTQGRYLAIEGKASSTTESVIENTSGKIIGTYFIERERTDINYHIENIPTENVNRIIYGFIAICGGDGVNNSLKKKGNAFNQLQNVCQGRKDFRIAINNPQAAIHQNFRGDYGLNSSVKGHYHQLMVAKKQNPKLKVLASIGGIKFSEPFFYMDDDEKRKTFVNSVKAFLKTWKFWDGIDVNFESPGGGENPNIGDKDKDGVTYVSILRDLRVMLDELGEETGRYFELTSVFSLAENKIALIDYEEASQYLDNLYLMAFDFYGTKKNPSLNHHSALYWSEINAVAHDYKFHTARGIDLLIKQGVPAEKLVMGIASYGYGWEGIVDVVDNNPFTGKAAGLIKGSRETGALDYQEIINMQSNNEWKYTYDNVAQAPYLWNENSGELISYDDPRSVKAKAEFVLEKKLAGIFHWVLEGDNGDLFNAAHQGLGHIIPDNEGKDNNPIARTGKMKEVTGPTSILLDGSDSTDPKGGTLDFQWSQKTGPNVEIMGASEVVARVDLPSVEKITNYIFNLTVTNAQGKQGSDDLVVENSSKLNNSSPVIFVTPTVYVEEGEDFTLTASGHDADNDTLTYEWNIASGLILLTSGNKSVVSLTAPEVESDTAFEFFVLVSDGKSETENSGQVVVRSKNNSDKMPLSVADIEMVRDDHGCALKDSNANKYAHWKPDKAYENQTVNYNGLVYKAKYWVQGSPPSPSNDAWNLVSKVSLPWNPRVAYYGDQEVNYNGSRWQAKWWTQGNIPGMGDVWLNIGPARCE